MRKKELEADNSLLRQGAQSLLAKVERQEDQIEALRDTLRNKRERLQYEASVIQSSLYTISQLIEEIDVALGVSSPGKRL